jgi:hypothetical protein
MSYKKRIYSSVFIGWSSLGFVRGMNFYDYRINKYNETACIENKKTKFYLSKFTSGIFGSFCYITPPFLFLNVWREIYRLEINLRGLDKEKEKDYYNEIYL